LNCITFHTINNLLNLKTLSNNKLNLKSHIGHLKHSSNGRIPFIWPHYCSAL